MRHFVGVARRLHCWRRNRRPSRSRKRAPPSGGASNGQGSCRRSRVERVTTIIRQMSCGHMTVPASRARLDRLGPSLSLLTIRLFRLLPGCVTLAPAADHVTRNRTIRMDMPGSEDSVDVAATFAVLDTLAASWRRLAGALCRRSRDHSVLENAPTTVVLWACVTDRFPLKALQGDLKAIRDARLRRVDQHRFVSERRTNHTENRGDAQRNKDEAHGSLSFVEPNHVRECALRPCNQTIMFADPSLAPSENSPCRRSGTTDLMRAPRLRTVRVEWPPL
jgi:hypothetical protein